MNSSSVKLMEQFSNWLLPFSTPEWASKSINFCHRRLVSGVFIEHWCVGSEWWGFSCSVDTAGSKPASSHWSCTLKWLQNFDSSSGSCLFVPWSFWWAGNQCLCWTVKHYTSQLTAPAATEHQPEEKLTEPAAHLRGWGELLFYMNTLSNVEMWVLYTVRY